MYSPKKILSEMPAPHRFLLHYPSSNNMAEVNALVHDKITASFIMLSPASNFLRYFWEMISYSPTLHCESTYYANGVTLTCDSPSYKIFMIQSLIERAWLKMDALQQSNRCYCLFTSFLHQYPIVSFPICSE